MTRSIALALLATVALCPAAATAEEPGEIMSFGDWVVGCDDTLACTAVGMAPDEGFNLAYLKIARQAGAETAPTLAVNLVLWDGSDSDEGLAMRLSLEGGNEALPVSELEATTRNGYVWGEISADETSAFTQALLPATGLRVEAEGSEDAASISLSGASAALRYMDAVQGRAGGVTAIVARGQAPTENVPGPREMQPVKAVKLTELDPVPALPEGIDATTSDECSEFATPQGFEAEGGARIFGTCQFSGAYNAAYRYWLVEAGGGEPKTLSFDLPGDMLEAGNLEDEPPVLVNAYLSDDGMRLGAFNKGRGLGDCGTSEEWAFTGEAFRLVSYSVMPECRGVAPEDWPVLVSIPTD